MGSTSTGNSHSMFMGYILWIFGFMGAHRFYYGKTFSGVLYFCTLGFLGVGWIIDLFLIPGMDRKADIKYIEGPYNYNVAWILLVFVGIFGVHRFYMGKWLSGILYFISGGIFMLGYVYDYIYLNEQVDELNRRAPYASR